MPKRIEYKKGDRVGPLRVKFIEDRPSRTRPSGQKARIVQAECPGCGRQWEVMLAHLKNGHTSCCPECKKKKSIEWGRDRATHGLFRTEPKMCVHPLFGTWMQIMNRCLNPSSPNWGNYGGRGITVCERWQGVTGFHHFLEDMGPRPGPYYSIDRINPGTDPYSKETCRWTSTRQQFNNRRTARKFTWRGEVRSLADIADMEGMNYDTLLWRLKRGMTIEEAVSKPVSKSYTPEPTLTYAGQTLSLSVWSKETGIPRLVLKSRKSDGWPVDLILETPAYSKFYGWQQNPDYEAAIERELDAKLEAKRKAA